MKKYSPFPGVRILTAPLCAIVFVVMVHGFIHAQSSTWNGGGTDTNWGTAGNWGGTALVAGNALNFGGIVQTSTNNNFTANTSFAGINFTNDGTAGKTSGFTLSGNAITLGGNIVLTADTGTAVTDTIALNMALSVTRIITGAANHNLSITGIISGGSGLSKQGGSGTLLTLSNLNTFSGALTLTSGTISFNTIFNTGVASALGEGGTIIAGAGNGTTGTLVYTGAATPTNRQFQLGVSTVTGTAGLIIENDGTGGLTFSNASFNVAFATSTAAKTLTLQGSNSGNNLISGAIIDNNTAGGGLIALAEAGTNTWTLAGANTFTGGVSLSSGTLNLNNAGSGGTSSALGTGAFTITGGTIDNTTASAITLSTANAIAFSGSFAFGGTQNLNLGGGVVTILGASRTLTLNNAATLTMGQLQWNSDADRTLTVSQGTGSGGTLVLGGFQLNINATTTSRTRIINGSGNVTITGAIVDGNTVSNNLTYSGTGVLTLSGNNLYSGLTTVSGGVVRLNNINALPGGTGSTGGTNGLLFNGTSSTNGVIQLTAATGDFTRSIVGLTPGAAQVGWSAAGWGGFGASGGDRTVNFGGSPTPTAITWSSGGGVLGGGLVLSDATSDSAVIVVNPIALSNANSSRTIQVNDGSAAVDAIMGGVLSSSTTAFVKTGNGTLAFTAANTYGSGFAAGTTGTTISAGTLEIGTGGSLGSISAGGDIVNNATLAFNHNDVLTVSNNITGTGVVNQIGIGTAALTGTNTYIGVTTISAGTLQLGNGGTTGSIDSTIGVTDNATLAFDRSDTITFAPAISGSGSVSQISSGIVGLSGSNSYLGGTTVTTGTLTFLNTGAKPATGITTVSANATLGLGVATSAGFFTSANVDSMFAGTMTNVSNDPASNVGIDTTVGNFTYASNVPATTRGLTKLGANTLTLTGSNSYTGPTTIANGILMLGSAGAVPGGIGVTGGISNIAFAGGIIGLTAVSGDFTRSIGTGPGQVQWTTGATGGFAAFGGNRTVNFAGNGAPSTVTWSNTNGVLGQGLVLGDSTSDSTVTVLNPIALNNSASSRTITVNDGSAAIDAVMAGALTSQLTANNGTRLIKNGAGTLALTGANVYVSGSSPVGTTVSAGTLMLGNGGTTGSLFYTPSTTGINSDVTIASGATLAFNRSDTGVAIPNLITGAGTVSQVGIGSTALSNANTYSGGTSVTAGALLVANSTGSATGTGAVTVSSGATLGGSGIIAPTGTNGVTVSGALSPSDPTVVNGVGTLSITPVDGSVKVTSTGTLNFLLFSNGTNGLTLTYNADGTINTLSGTPSSTGNDRLVFNSSGAGLLDFSQSAAGSINITFAGGYTPQALDTFDLMDWSSLGVTGLNAGLLSLPSLSGPNLFWDTSKFASDGVIAVGQTVAPEPTRALLVLVGLGSLCLRRRR